MSAQLNNLLTTEDLKIGYSEKNKSPRILQDHISVSVAAGEIVSLMGQNGVGKTTFIKTISGLIPLLAGRVWYKNQPLESLSTLDLARRLSIVLTERPYASNISVLEVIAIGRHPYSGWTGTLSPADKNAIDKAISDTHIDYLADQKLYELSDGQMQKVMIARALAQETDLILLDEPAAHLDLYNKIEVMLLLRQIARQGKGILISTHDMQISTQLSDRLWLFNFNAPTIEGTPEDLILNGTLERTLYLQDYGYDMIHGTLNLPMTGPEVQVAGHSERAFWTIQALKRNGYRIKTEASMQIDCQAERWVINLYPQSHCLSIEQLLFTLKQHFQQKLATGS